MKLTTRQPIPFIFLLGTLLSAILPTHVFAQNSNANQNKSEDNAQGKWTFGVGLMAARINHYQGSDQNRSVALPFPYIRYQSKKVTIDREGIKSKFFSGKNWDISLSGGGQVKVNSDDNNARAGMPDLAWVGAVGPVLNYYLNDDRSKLMQWHVRKAFSFDSGIKSVGYLSQLTYKQTTELPSNTWGQARLITTANLNFASNAYNDYLYGVESQYATIDRPTYDADGGFAGSQLQLTYQLRNHPQQDKFRAAAFIRATNLSGSEFEDSPLVKQTTNINFGMMYAWLF